jgi:protein gp37
MGDTTTISWCDMTWNPWEGCTQISPACKNCYALTRNVRFHGGANWGKGALRRRTSKSNWKLPLRWNRIAENEAQNNMELGPSKSGKAHRPRVFCASLADWLDDEVPIEWLADLLALIHATPNLNWLLLTKRPENWKPRLEAVARICGDAQNGPDPFSPASEWLVGDAPANVWLGVTVEDQQRADERIPLLLSIPAKVRFLSCEPLLSSIDLSPWIGYRIANENELHRRTGNTQGDPCEQIQRGQPGEDLEGKQKGGEQNSAGIFANTIDDQQCEASLRSASHCVSGESGSDPTRIDDQSQERNQRRQQTGESGTGDLFATSDTRDENSRKAPAIAEPERRKEPFFQTERQPDRPDSEGVFCEHRSHTSNVGDKIRSVIPANQQDRQRRQEGRGEIGLHAPSKPFKSSETMIHLCIVGGESGHHARPMHPDWARSLRDQCQAAGVAFHFKQFGEHDAGGNRVGMKRAGRILDGREWNEFPK